MNTRILGLVLATGFILACVDAGAAITGARATPRQATLTGTGTSVVTINWRVNTTADHRDGVASATGAIISPTSREPLLDVRRNLFQDGVGPYTLREVLTLDAETVRQWLDLGLNRVVFTRTFADAVGGVAEASVVLRLNRSRLQATRDATSGELNVTSLRLEFDSGNNTELAALDDKLRARLTVTHTGTGVLSGRWQIAEPESSIGVPLYRTLGLVNKNLTSSQRSVIPSPALPTNRSGKYLLRFCVTTRSTEVSTGDVQCPNTELVAIAAYQVQGVALDSVSRILDIAPDRESVSEADEFSWRPLADARVYQLQIFEPSAAAAKPPTSRIDSASLEPKFVTGMVLPAATTRAPLSELVLSRLEPGSRYLWRVTALDAEGRLVGRSGEAHFIYAPAD